MSRFRRGDRPDRSPVLDRSPRRVIEAAGREGLPLRRGERTDGRRTGRERFARPLLGVAILIGLLTLPARAIACNQDEDCDDGLNCDGREICHDGSCFLSFAGPCLELACREDGSTIYCDGRELIATGGDVQSWTEFVALDPAVRIGLGIFSPSIPGRLFDERTYAPADVGSRFVATQASDADFDAIAGRLGDGQDGQVGICRATTSGGLPSQSTCEPQDESLFFGVAPDRVPARIDLVVASLSFTPQPPGTAVAMTLEVQLLPECSSVGSQAGAALLLAAAGWRRRARPSR